MDNTYSFKQLFFIIWYRGWQILRGLFLKFRITAAGLVFCGRNVIVEHGYNVRAGKSLIIEDGVHINALSANGIIAGDNVTIAKYAVLTCTGVIANKGIGIKVGNNSAIGAQSFIGGQGGITIGNDVIMGPQVKIFSENHNFQDRTIVIRKQGETRLGVNIGDNCWIGAGVTILDGVKIGAGTVIAAGSVVTKDLPSDCLAAGVPARVLRQRAL